MAAAEILSARVTVPSLLKRKNSTSDSDDGPGRITALTAYDFISARLVDRAGIDLILVGDSLGSIIQGNATTLPVTIDEMVYHSRCVVKGVQRALVVGDMPFLSYQESVTQAIHNAGRLVKEGGVAAVKLEGGVPFKETIRRLVEVDIPVVGHIGLTPQSYHRMGGYKIQGRARRGRGKSDAGTYERIVEDALAIEEAGAFLLVIEGVPAELASEITRCVSIPTIGIGAGAGCDGQILVLHDMLGMNDTVPRFVKEYAEIASGIDTAVRSYIGEVRAGTFPAEEHTVHTVPAEARRKGKIRNAAGR